MKRIIQSCACAGVILALPGFGACTLTGNVNPAQQQQIAEACATIAAAEDSLALVPAAKLAPYHDRIAAAIKLKQPVCNAKPEPANISAAAMASLMAAATNLGDIRAALTEGK